MIRAASGNEEITDGYGLARALLAERGPDGHEPAHETIARIVHNVDCSKRDAVWQTLAEEAEHHGVAPLLQPIIAAPAAKMLVPDRVRRAFFALASRHRRAAVAREACIDQLLEAFAVAGVPIILLKGAALAHRIYGDPGLRPMGDIDVLIDPADTQEGVSIVKDLGYSFASRQGSRFSGRMHHLPVATMRRSGFQMTLEIHLDTMSPNQGGSLSFRTLSAKPESFRRGAGPEGLTLGHADMLRHLGHHAFEPAVRVRLIHLYDLWRYQTIFHDQIDWRTVAARFPEVSIILQLVAYVFTCTHPGEISSGSAPAVAGVGFGMAPLSEVSAAHTGCVGKLAAVLNPPAWWLHGFYGIPPQRSLVPCRTIRHPATVFRWLARRLIAGLTTSPVVSDYQRRAAAKRTTTSQNADNISEASAQLRDRRMNGVAEEAISANRYKIISDLALRNGAHAHTRASARNNLYYYLVPLSDLCPSFNWKVIPFEAPDGYIAMNPSACMYANALYCNVRCVNYWIDHQGRYCNRKPNGEWTVGEAAYWRNNPIITRNFILHLGAEPLVPTKPWPIYELQCCNIPCEWPLVRGFEDVRLFSWKQDLWTSATVRQLHPDGNCEQVLSRVLPLKSRVEEETCPIAIHADVHRMLRQPRTTEKNWAPILGGDSTGDSSAIDAPWFMCRPGEVVNRDGVTICKHDTGLASGHISGSSQLIPFCGDWLSVVHEANQVPGSHLRYYQHRFAQYDNEFRLVHFSLPFYFNSKAIEFCAGMCWHPNCHDLVISYGHKDESARIATVSADEVERLLHR